MKIRFDYRAIVQHAPRGDSVSGSWPPLIAIDECLNSETTSQAVAKLCSEGLAGGSGPLWLEQRTRPDGSIYYAAGGVSKASSLPWDRGVQTKGFVWDDQNVVAWLAFQLHAGRPLVLLTENMARDELGLRRILREHVGPAVDARGDLALHALFKKGKTSYSDYWAQVRLIFQGRQWANGYHEVLISKL
jgi:hypothetical protein